jgi:hypothetical protein
MKSATNIYLHILRINMKINCAISFHCDKNVTRVLKCHSLNFLSKTSSRHSVKKLDYSTVTEYNFENIFLYPISIFLPLFIKTFHYAKTPEDGWLVVNVTTLFQ